MDMLDPRINYAVMATEDRVRRLLRERSLKTQPRQVRQLPDPRREGTAAEASLPSPAPVLP